MLLCTSRHFRAKRGLLYAALLALAICACSEKSSSSASSGAPTQLDLPPAEAAPADRASIDTGKKTALPTFRRCTFGLPPMVKGAFRHQRSRAIAELERSAHSAQDVIAKPGAAFTIPGNYAYGRVRKDLEDENVFLFLNVCENWTGFDAVLTDGDGRSAVEVSAKSSPGPGRYEVVQTAQGSNDFVHSLLTIAPEGTRIVVFGVDGTLTIGDDELAEKAKADELDKMISGKLVTLPFPDAAAITKAWQAKGYLVVYMTGRPYWLATMTRQWLAKQGFPDGHLHTTDRNRDALPTQGGVGEFKADYLKKLISDGYKIDYVYGNAESDIFAYAEAGISPAKTHIIGEFGGQGGTQALEESYTGHMKWVSEQPNAKQPFVLADPQTQPTP